MAAPSRIRHVPALDGLRGFAVGAVVLFHGQHLVGGYLGVDVFFVLSGYLITTLLLAESEVEGSVGLGGFWSRRARRLLPALGVFLLGVAAYAWLLAPATELDAIRRDGLATIAYVANWRAILAHQDYWAIFRSASPLDHTWSLSIEEQFYILWPLVFVGILAVARRRTAPAVLGVCLTLAAGSAALMVLLYEPGNTARAYYGTDTRVGAILLGASFAAWTQWRGPITSRIGRLGLELAGWSGLIVLVAAMSRVGGESYRLYHGGFLLVELATVAVIAVAAHPQAGPLSRLLSWRPLVGLGLISYGVYLWHWLVDVTLTPDRIDLDGWSLFTLQCAITLAISIASYRLVEMPIRRGAGHRSAWAVALPASAAVVTAAVVVATLGAQPAPGASDDLRAGPGGVLVVGDSVARSIAPGLARAGYPVTDDGLVGCRLVRGRIDVTNGAYRHGCPWGRVFPRFMRETRPRTVVLVSGAFDLYDVRPPGSDTWLQPGTEAWARYYRREVLGALRTLHRPGRPVVMTDVPYIASLGYGKVPGSTRSAFNPERVRAANEILADIAAEHPDLVRLVAFNRFLAPRGSYQSWLGAVQMARVDGVHFTPAAADLIADWLGPQLGYDGPLRGPARSGPAGTSGPTGARDSVG